MKTKATKGKIAETVVGVGIGAAIAGPNGVVAGGLGPDACPVLVLRRIPKNENGFLT